MTNAQLVDKLKARVEVVEEIYGSIGSDPNLIKDELDAYLKEIGVDASNSQASHTTWAQSQTGEKYISIILLSAADSNWSGGRLLQELKNYTLKGKFTFPGTLVEALVMLNDYSATASMLRSTDGYDQFPFAQKVDSAPNTHKKDCCSIPGLERRQQNKVKDNINLSLMQK